VSAIDWIIVAAYLALSLGLGLYHMRRATQGIDDYFLSGRKASWWILGTSMAATSFAADTPLAVSGFVIKNGISWNWFWWGSAMGGMLVVFFFSRLWRRSRVTTDVEFIELRYSGRTAGFLRGYLAVHSGVLVNCIYIGWVNLAMVKVLSLTIGIQPMHALYFCFGFSLLYTMLAGLRGVMATDFVQFIISMAGAIAVAVVAVQGVGGLEGMHAGLVRVHGAQRAAEITAFFPRLGSDLFVPVLTFIFFQWWAASNVGGGSLYVQRMLSARNEKHAFFGMLWYNIAQYCLRSWPWILAGLCAAILYPGLQDPEAGYIVLMNRLLPSGLLGLVVASLFAAYMSTIDTHLNWGASYLVNDLYKRFIRPAASQRHYVAAAMAATVLLGILGMVVTTLMSSIREGWYIVTAISGGVTVITILRWYWWRINAWSEITAMASALVCTIIFRVGLDIPHPQVLFYVVPITVALALVATFITQPVEEAKLLEFYCKVRPGGPLWGPIAAKARLVRKDEGFATLIPAYLVSVVAIYTAMFGVGKLLLGPVWLGAVLIAAAIASSVLVWRIISAFRWSDD
jgi:SSS family solute:Na+ symporter